MVEISQLESMGFDRAASAAALAASRSLDAAVELLCSPSYLVEMSKGRQWSCNACTYLNKSPATLCEMCLTPAPDVLQEGRFCEDSFAIVEVYKSNELSCSSEIQQRGKKGERQKASNAKFPHDKQQSHEKKQKKRGRRQKESKDGKNAKSDSGKYDKEMSLLKPILLSPGCCTEKINASPAQERSTRVLSEGQLIELFRSSVEEFDSILDRTKSFPVSTLLVKSYSSGLPLYNAQPAIREHTRIALNYIVDKALSCGQKERRRILTRLAEAFTSCQAEQGRVIDALYGTVSGRDKGLLEQVLALVDEQKQRVLDQVTNVLNPGAWKTGDGSPNEQVPHIQSAYTVAVGHELGLRGVQAAMADYCAPKISSSTSKRVVDTFWKLFSVEELAQTLVDDVNQQSEQVDRLIDREALMRWAGDKELSRGFQSHSLFYDEDRAEEYQGKPREENSYQPYLSMRIAFDILMHLFIK